LERKVLQSEKELKARLKIEQNLRESEGRLIEAQHLARMGDFIWDLEKDEISFSAGLYDLLRYDRFETFNYARLNADIHYQDDLPEITRWLNNALDSAQDKLPPKEYRIIRKDKKVLYVRATGKIKRRTGKKPLIFATILDISELRKAKSDLQKEHDEMLALFDNVEDVIYVTDMDTYEILFVNRFTKKSFGKDLIGDICYKEFQHLNEPCEFCTNKIIKQLKNKSYQWEYHNPVTDHDYDIRDRMIQWPDGRQVRFELARDITERKKVEGALKESQRQLSTLMSNLPGMAYRCKNDPEWSMEFISEGCLQLTGYKNETLVNNAALSYGDIIHPEDRQMVWNEVQAGLQENRPFQMSYRIITASREEKWVWEQGQGIYDSENNLVSLEGFISDINKRKLGEIKQEILYKISDALNTTNNVTDLCTRIREYLGKVIDTTNFYVALYDEDTQTISLPFDIDEKDGFQVFPAGKTLTAYVIKTGEPLLASKQLMDKLTREGKIEVIGSRSEIWLGVPLKIEDKVIGVIAVQSYDTPNLYKEEDIKILTFVSEEIAIAIKRTQSEELIRKELMEKNTLLQELYHRTKNNMQVISSMLNMQSRKFEQEKSVKSNCMNLIKDTFQEITNRINAMSLVHQKLYQSKDLSRINLREYIEELLPQIGQGYIKQSGNVSVNLELKDVLIDIDSAIPLGLVLNELVSNAFKFAFPDNKKGEITIILNKENDGKIHLTVRDNGIGVPEDLNLREHNSMGLNTMFTLIEYQLKGTVGFKVKNGLRWDITINDNSVNTRV